MMLKAFKTGSNPVRAGILKGGENMDKQYVIVFECSAGNDSVGNMWLETYICKPETTIGEIIKWKEEKPGNK